MMTWRDYIFWIWVVSSSIGIIIGFLYEDLLSEILQLYIISVQIMFIVAIIDFDEPRKEKSSLLDMVYDGKYVWSP